MAQISFLGFLVSDQGIQADPDKVRPIINLPAPTKIKEVERFLGMTGVYQKFIAQYQVMIEPIRRLKIEDTPFVWESEQEQAFRQLKKSLAYLPFLKQPDFSMPFELHCDAATSAGIAVILCQRYDDTPYPLSFASRSATKFEQKYSWLLNTDPGKTNHAADALSRAAINHIEQQNPDVGWEKEQALNPQLKPYINNTNLKYKHYKVVVNKILYKVEPKSRNALANNMYIVIPQHLVTQIISKFHDSKFAGHGGIWKTSQTYTSLTCQAQSHHTLPNVKFVKN